MEIANQPFPLIEAVLSKIPWIQFISPLLVPLLPYICGLFLKDFDFPDQPDHHFFCRYRRANRFLYFVFGRFLPFL